ncbi:predicted protein [Histoplasma mississippiense (nom. inval.)]|uniref:predicted protein n=1 Tax=Ajellomyces capsulatus (strain NAm1 / WU24) TaxID=2059318 RepID=UPI000157C032|nr:predicted protein [Histoplasma mississippiense (nom. inval.)]EDN06626.1 predicted protein [Histoplasma mississippiense (nom. inval.)]
MASADIPHDGLHHTVIISSDSEMDERQPPARKLRRKRLRTDYSYPMYGAQFDDPAPSEMSQPPKRRNLDVVLETANQEIHKIFKAEHAQREALEKEVQRLRAEMTRKDERVDKLETKVRELKDQCRCQICFTIPSGWRTLLCGHRYCPKCVPPIGGTCSPCRQVITGVIKSY